MKTKALRVLSGVAFGATAITGALATPALGSIIPPQYSVWIGIATGILFAAKEVAVALGDKLDDGEVNDSFKP